VGWGAGEAAHQVAALMREGVSPEVTRKFFYEMSSVDCADLLARVACPTLVMAPRHFPLVGFDQARDLAAGIPGARLELFEGSSLAPTRADMDGIIAAIGDFLGEQAAGAPDARPPPDASRHQQTEALSRRELEVLRLLAQGKSNREIANDLVLSTRTVDRHVANIYTKLDLRTRVQAAAYALRHHLT
jgi:DNA-binding CsgD family transcriptional regulator